MPCVFEASLGSISPFYAPVCYAGAVWAARSHPGLQPIAGEPLAVPQWRHSQPTEPSWSSSWESCSGAGTKVGKLPHFPGCSTEHPSPVAGVHGNPKSSPASRPVLQREAPSSTDPVAPSLPTRGGIIDFSICIIIRTFPQEINSYVSRSLTHWWTGYPGISSRDHPPLPVNPKSTLLWGMMAWNLNQPTSLSSQQHFGAFLDPEAFKNIFI